MSGAFAGLVVDKQVGEVTLAFEAAIVESFRLRPHFLRLTKASAIQDRFAILARIFRTLRGDLKWSIARI